MNKSVFTSISLLGSGVVIGVIVCIAGLTAVEWQKASKVSQLHKSSNRQLAERASTDSDTNTSQTKSATKARNLHAAQASSKSSSRKAATGVSSSAANASTSQATASPTPVGPAARTVIPNILHQALQTAAMQGQWAGGNNGMASLNMVPENAMVSGTGMVPGTVEMMPTTYIIPQPDIQILVPGKAGPARAVDSQDSMPMPIGRNGLQQNPCVDPGSSYGRAYNRGSSY